MKIRWFFGFFLVSGFCSLVYEVVWLRLGMADFGVTTAVTSIILSVFMAGLALGSWLAGRVGNRVGTHGLAGTLRVYAAVELCIGISGVLVPRVLPLGRGLLEHLGVGAVWGSTGYHVACAAWIAVILLPPGALMGATIPLGMSAIRGVLEDASPRAFSYLYLANVLGALAGTISSAFVLIEILGFRGTSLAAASLNVLVAASAWVLAGVAARGVAERRPASSESRGDKRRDLAVRGVPWLLFATGMMSLAMEVVWIRQFTPYLGTVVYAFAAVLALYLGATFLGSKLYRSWAAVQRKGGDEPPLVLAGAWAGVGVSGLLPLVTADPRLPLGTGLVASAARVALGVMPFCALAGFLTPLLVDRWSHGDPSRAGSAYSLNVLGCIVGPLLAGFVLLPHLGEAWSLFTLAVPPVLLGLLYGFGGTRGRSGAGRRSIALLAAVAAASALVMAATRSYETQFDERVVLRDHTATVVATGRGFERQLLVNGYGMTALTPISKSMAHLPLVLLSHPPRDGLVICFGMGTTFRSMLSWKIPTTVVELVPSVPDLFAFYHEDAREILESADSRVVIDDGRRFLESSTQQYDVITLDPPPPVEAAGSSLLYSREFYETVKRHLRPGGIFQQWFPGGERAIAASVARTVRESFPHVRSYQSVLGWGLHFVASMDPIPDLPASRLIGRIPQSAAADLAEWGPGSSPREQLDLMLSRQVATEKIVALASGAPLLTDDRPFNEYFLLRRALARPPE